MQPQPNDKQCPQPKDNQKAESIGRQYPQSTQYFSFQSTKVVDDKGNQSIIIQDKRRQSQPYQHITNLQIHQLNNNSLYQSPHKLQGQKQEADPKEKVKQHFKSMGFQNNKVDESCLQDFQYFISKLPNQSDVHQNLCGKSFISDMNVSFLKDNRKTEISPSSLMQKEIYKMKTNWMNQFQVKCVIDYNGKKVPTVCCIKDAQLQFQNGGCSFRLTKITKMKVLYQNYQKIIIFTYDDLKSKRNSQFKFKIFIDNQVKDDLYLLFSKIIVQKLLLLDYQIDMKEGQDLDADKFMMSGQIYKKAQVINQWNLRKVVISDRIESYKDDKKTFEMTNIKEVWTRFEVYQKNLIVKIRHGKEKTQIAIPIVNYQIKFCKKNWLFRLYSLLNSS